MLETILVVVTHSAELAAQLPPVFELTGPTTATVVMTGASTRHNASGLLLKHESPPLSWAWPRPSPYSRVLCLLVTQCKPACATLFLQRLGNTSYAIADPGFFREQLAVDIQAQNGFGQGGFTNVVPLIALEGTVVMNQAKRRGAGIRVYGC